MFKIRLANFLALLLVGFSLVSLSFSYQPNCTSFRKSRTLGGDLDLFDYEPLTPRSLPDACKDATANPRGKYTANLAACTFRFHRVSQEDEVPNLSPFRLSTVCSEDNLVGGKEGTSLNTVEEYVKKWPDDCVGDFQRCYSVTRDETIFLEFVCLKGWTFPDGTTHVSVTCTADKARKLEQIEESSSYRHKDPEDDLYFQAKERHLRDLKVWILSLVAGCIISVMVFFGVSYRMVIQPYFKLLCCQLSDGKDEEKLE